MRQSPPNRRVSFPLRHRLLRLAWMVTWTLLASWTPVPLRSWRRALLKLFGARLGPNSDVRGSARVWYPPNLVIGRSSMLAARVNCYNMGMVTIGDHVIVSQDAELIGGTHDVDAESFDLITKPIVVGDWCWIASGATVGPGVTMAEGAVLGARGVAFSALERWTVYAGNPARAIRERRHPARDRRTTGK
jgi:putative colanic acid biosynthesis acetyltransferase WcaF